MPDTGLVRFRVILAVTAILLSSAPSALARPTDKPIPSAVVTARAEYSSALLSAEQVLRESQKAAEAAYREALKVAGTKEAMTAAQARALAWNATMVSQARERHAPVIAAGVTVGERRVAVATLERELREIERTTQESLRIARQLLNAKFARAHAERVRTQSLLAATLVYEGSKRAALSRLNEVLLRYRLPMISG